MCTDNQSQRFQRAHCDRITIAWSSENTSRCLSDCSKHSMAPRTPQCIGKFVGWHSCAYVNRVPGFLLTCHRQTEVRKLCRSREVETINRGAVMNLAHVSLRGRTHQKSNCSQFSHAAKDWYSAVNIHVYCALIWVAHQARSHCFANSSMAVTQPVRLLHVVTLQSTAYIELQSFTTDQGGPCK